MLPLTLRCEFGRLHSSIEKENISPGAKATTPTPEASSANETLSKMSQLQTGSGDQLSQRDEAAESTAEHEQTVDLGGLNSVINTFEQAMADAEE